MAGSATLGASLLERVGARIADSLRGSLNHAFGVRPYKTYREVYIWSGTEPGDGEKTRVSRHEVTPSPDVKEGVRRVLMPGGIMEQGYTELREVSLTYTEDDIFARQQLDQPDAPTLTGIGGASLPLILPLIFGAHYAYRVAAVNRYGLYTAASDATSTTGPLTLDDDNTLTATWDAVAGAESYDVYRQDTDTDQPYYYVGSTADTTLTDDGLTADTDRTAPTLDLTDPQALPVLVCYVLEDALSQGMSPRYFRVGREMPSRVVNDIGWLVTLERAEAP